jgi:hypothetical protein
MTIFVPKKPTTLLHCAYDFTNSVYDNLKIEFIEHPWYRKMCLEKLCLQQVFICIWFILGNWPLRYTYVHFTNNLINHIVSSHGKYIEILIIFSQSKNMKRITVLKCLPHSRIIFSYQMQRSYCFDWTYFRISVKKAEECLYYNQNYTLKHFSIYKFISFCLGL